ncbi:unnamed protein product [Fraxinus pennsylvanica]|uniref:MADS-box domain-containing protein n=1 Tax=Fraxinus pennsylvanica TaxID=56036 RepID=A0AAD2A0R6_9LAMI|nr:unnamed protein product [Fraxinus pennsylvanica]
MELSVLCDVKAYIVILSPDRQIETWPENHSDVREVIDLNKNDYLNNKKRNQQHDDDGCKKKWVLGGDKWALEDFLKKVKTKIDRVKKRIQVVKSKDQETNSGYSFVKYVTLEEAIELGYSFSYLASEVGNPLSGGILRMPDLQKVHKIWAHTSVR